MAALKIVTCSKALFCWILHCFFLVPRRLQLFKVRRGASCLSTRHRGTHPPHAAAPTGAPAVLLLLVGAPHRWRWYVCVTSMQTHVSSVPALLQDSHQVRASAQDGEGDDLLRHPPGLRGGHPGADSEGLLHPRAQGVFGERGSVAAGGGGAEWVPLLGGEAALL